jgi:hypothetical protein
MLVRLLDIKSNGDLSLCSRVFTFERAYRRRDVEKLVDIFSQFLKQQNEYFARTNINLRNEVCKDGGSYNLAKK